MLTLLLDFAPSDLSKDVEAQLCEQSLKTVLKDAQLAGFSTVQISCSNWTKQLVDVMVRLFLLYFGVKYY
jgi:hypothetical protein